MSKVFVTGHKNPDTDSICSALSYAALKQAQGVEAVAVRLGEVNPLMISTSRGQAWTIGIW